MKQTKNHRACHGRSAHRSERLRQALKQAQGGQQARDDATRFATVSLDELLEALE